MNEPLRNLFEMQVYYLWTNTYYLAPILLGFLFGRYFHTVLRLLIISPILISSYYFCKYSDHGFWGFMFGNLLFLISGFTAYVNKMKKDQRQIISFHTTDWAVLFIANLIFLVCYIEPMQ